MMHICRLNLQRIKPFIFYPESITRSSPSSKELQAEREQSERECCSRSKRVGYKLGVKNECKDELSPPARFRILATSRQNGTLTPLPGGSDDDPIQVPAT